MYKKLISLLLLTLTTTGTSFAVECAYVANEMESVVRYSDTSKVVDKLNDVNKQLASMIEMCGKRAHAMKPAPIPKIKIYDKKSNRKNCNTAIITKQAENAQRAVGVQVGRVRDAANTTATNTELLSTILAECIKKK